MGRRNAGSPVKLAEIAGKRKSGARAMRRAQEALDRKMSIPAMKKLIRRNRQAQQ